jgi:hypothetical protein
MPDARHGWAQRLFAAELTISRQTRRPASFAVKISGSRSDGMPG